MKITGGRITMPQRIVAYGPEGIGKSEFGSQFPKPLYIDTEGSTERLDVQRTPKVSSWAMLMSQIDELIKNNHGYQTLVIDTIDWAERLAVDHVCAAAAKTGIEDFGYGKGYSYLYEEMGRLLNKLNDLRASGMNVLLLAHAALRKFEQPEESGTYDRWEMKLRTSGKTNVSQLVKEWADMVLFINYETFLVTTDNGKKKAQGGKRVMYTTHHTCWDAKNRHGLPEKLDFPKDIAYQQIAKFISGETAPTKTAQEPKKEEQKKEPEQIEKSLPTDELAFNHQLYDLMTQYEVTEEEIQEAVSRKGYYPKQTPLHIYDEKFVLAKLVGKWEQVFGFIKTIRNERVKVAA